MLRECVIVPEPFPCKIPLIAETIGAGKARRRQEKSPAIRPSEAETTEQSPRFVVFSR